MVSTRRKRKEGQVEFELYTKRREIERLEQEQERLLPLMQEEEAQWAKEEKRLEAGRKRAKRLLTAGEKAGLKFLPKKGTAHYEGLEYLLAHALRDHKQELWEVTDPSGNRIPAMAVMATPTASYAHEEHGKKARKIKRLQREVRRLEREKEDADLRPADGYQTEHPDDLAGPDGDDIDD